jgi:hypothetical protein
MSPQTKVVQLTQSTPAKVLFIFTFFTQFVGVLYSARAVELPALFQLLYSVATAWLFWWWLTEDSKQTGARWPSMDLGFLLFVAWIVIIPYHLFATRGWRGFIGILTYVGVFLAGWLAAVFVSIILWS